MKNKERIEEEEKDIKTVTISQKGQITILETFKVKWV